MLLYDYFRSSAAYRIRIALGLKGVPFDRQEVHLVLDGGQHRTEAYARINPEQLVPALQDGSHVLTQSLAILEYLEETRPEPPLLPKGAVERAWVRGLAAQIACDIHSLNNLRVLQYLEHRFECTAAQKSDWYAHWVSTGFKAIERRLADVEVPGLCCHGDTPTFADCCLVPQVFNARRFGVPMDPYPNINRIHDHLARIDAFRQASPDAQAHG